MKNKVIKEINSLLQQELDKSNEYREFKDLFPGLKEKMIGGYQQQISVLAEKQVSHSQFTPSSNYNLFEKQNGFEMIKLIKDNRTQLRKVYPDIPFEGFLNKYESLYKEIKAKPKNEKDNRKWKASIYSKAEKIKKAILYAIHKSEENLANEQKIAERLKFISKIVSEIIERIKKFNLLRAMNPEAGLAGNFWDLSVGSWQKGSMEKLLKWKEKFDNNTELKKIINSIGRSKSFSSCSNQMMRVVKRIKRKSYENEFKEEIIGVTEGNDISAMLSSELIYLSDETLSPIFYMKYAENKLPIYEFRNEFEVEVMEEGLEEKKEEEKKVQMGPVILCIDTSGSMQGLPEEVAKCLSLSVILRALGEKRPVYLISFGTDIETTVFNPDNFSIQELMEFMSMSFNKGTDAGPALTESVRMLKDEKFKDADVVMVSDFIMGHLNNDLVRKIEVAKKADTRFLALVVNSSTTNVGIPHFDKTWLMNVHDPEKITEVIGM